MRNAGGCENAECSLMHVRECEVRNAVAARDGSIPSGEGGRGKDE